MATETEVLSRQPQRFDFTARARGSHSNKSYEATLELATHLSGLHAKCQLCNKTTQQHLAAFNIDVNTDCEAAIIEAMMRVSTNHSATEPTAVYKITKAATMEIVNAAGQEIREGSDVFAQMEKKIAGTLEEKEVCDGCMMHIEIGAF